MTRMSMTKHWHRTGSSSNAKHRVHQPEIAGTFCCHVELIIRGPGALATKSTGVVCRLLPIEKSVVPANETIGAPRGIRHDWGL